ncbi:outer membrane protein assembly factor BamB family protein [Geoalkalibacter sp.]|uniref:outer membrane protein assembly factor BamB family protein n=1 Tax=Geoalkalibacter sp. TaxID=3041440 RepID=UPI00272E232E|nr:PQQ-binding-like beta-propeller repeat protein [Geoalkalibacter sp.]
MVRFFPALLLTLLLGACTASRPLPPSEAPPLVLGDLVLDRDTLWQGRILIDGAVQVPRGLTLTIAPGTEIAFVRRDLDEDGLGDATLMVDGRLLARGTRAAPIVFRSAEADPQPGDWLEIHINFSPEVHLQYCEIRDSAHGIHAHFTRGLVENSIIRHNIDGTRLGRARFTIRNSLIEHNLSKGINFRDSQVEVRDNILRYNGAGVFLFEMDRDSIIQGNNFHDNEYHVRLGDFFTGAVRTGENWWGSSDPSQIAARIYDQALDPDIGTVSVVPAAAWLDDTGPRDALALEPLRRHETQGFVDAPPLLADGLILHASWDGTLRALDGKGRQRWRQAFADVLDAPLAGDGERVFGQTWGREVFALALADGRPLWRFTYAESPADDHRQGGLVVAGDLVLVPAWNGTLHALDRSSGAQRWSFDSGAVLRAAPAVAADRCYLVDAAGTVSALDLNGRLLWRRGLDEPLPAAPVSTPEGLAVLGKEGTLTLLSPQGEILWRRPLAEPCFYAAPVYTEGTLLVATAGAGLWRLSAADGSVLWRRPLAGPSYATPLVHGGRIFVGDNSGVLEVFNLESGASLTRLQVGGAIQGAPRALGDQLLFGARDQALHVVRIVDAEITAED